jgi:hypothetical protein
VNPSTGQLLAAVLLNAMRASPSDRAAVSNTAATSTSVDQEGLPSVTQRNSDTSAAAKLPMAGTGRTSRRVLRWVTAAALLAAVTAPFVVAVIGGEVRSTSQPSAGHQPADRTPTARPAADPKAVLERLARDVAAAPPDPARARYEYIDVRVWESTLPSTTMATTTTPPAFEGAPARRIQVWTTGRGGGRAVAIDEQHGCPPVSDQPIDDLGPFDGPLPTDSDALRRHILHEHPEPAAPDAMPDVFGQIAEFYGSRYVPLPTRQGVLRMLARQPGVGVQGEMVDRAGRTGLAVTWTYRLPAPLAAMAKTLIFDPRTGWLLASHSRTIPNPTTAPPLTDPGLQYEGYTLYLASAFTATTATPALACRT